MIVYHMDFMNVITILVLAGGLVIAGIITVAMEIIEWFKKQMK